MDPQDYWGLGGGALVIAIMQAAKTVWADLPKEAMPIAAILVSVGIQIYAGSTMGIDIGKAIFTGIVVGLASMGFYSGQKATRGQ